MNIVIADDEKLVRVSLLSMINEMEASWEILGEATDGEELVDLVARYMPEVAIVDIRMPHMDGIEAIRKAKGISPRTKWIICSGYSDCIQCEFSLAVRQHMTNHLVYGANMALITLASGEFVTVGVWDPEKTNAHEQVTSFINDMEKVMSRFRSDKIAISAIQTEECHDFAAFLDQTGQIQKIACLRSVKGLNRKWMIKELTGFAPSGVEMRIANKIVQLVYDYKNSLYVNFQKTLEDLEVLLVKGNTTTLTTSFLLTTQQYINIVFDITLQDGHLKQWMQPLRTLGEALLAQNHSQSSMDLVDYVIATIEMNYMNNIGIGQIAGELDITSSYLSKLFHKKIGTTFVKYLTRVRILKAKELLLESNLQIGQVAEQVGYYSTRHFTKLFTEVVGVYPSDFKRSIMQK